MKSFPFSAIKLSFFALMLSFCTSAFSQKTFVWKGGTPGKTNDWNCARNWSTFSVPDEFSNVVVPDVTASTLASPVIATGKIEVNSLYIASNASLTIEDAAQLVVIDKAGSHIPTNMHLKGSIFFLDDAANKKTSAFTAANY